MQVRSAGEKKAARVWCVAPHFKEMRGRDLGDLENLNGSYALEKTPKGRREMKRTGQMLEAGLPPESMVTAVRSEPRRKVCLHPTLLEPLRCPDQAATKNHVGS